VTRYAVYAVPGLTPADGAIAERMRALGESALERTTGARRYGWHATLKAPFRLADGVSVARLREALQTFAAERSAVIIPEPALRHIGRFWAIVPGRPSPDLAALADDAVRELDDLRAPLTEDDRARRHPARLTDRQRELLERWGYPFVLDEFRFHCTLTDDLDDRAGEAVGARLAEEFGPVLGRDIRLTSIALFSEPGPGAPFELDSIFDLHIAERLREDPPAVQKERS
jgi:hypothetical protein